MSFFTNLLKWKVPRLNAAGTGLVGSSGTAGFVDAGLFGASPDASAAVNTAAIQAALDVAALWSGYDVTYNTPGTTEYNKCLIVSSYTTFTTGNGVELKLASGSNCNMIRNKSAQIALPYNKLTVSGSVATVDEMGHTRKVGDQVYVENVQGNTSLNGAKTITGVNGTLWTFAASGSNPTNTEYQRIFLGPVNQIAGANIVRASNVVTVTEAGHRRNAGDNVYVTGLTDTTFNGIQVVADVDGNTWSYENTGDDGAATGTANIIGDTRIHLQLSKLHGNMAGNTWDELYSVPLLLGNLGNSYVWADHIQDGGSRATQLFASNNIIIPYHYASGGKGTLQIESGCGTIIIGDLESGPITDDVLAWGVTPQTAPFGETACPSGMKSMGRLYCNSINGITPTGQLKLFGETGYSLGTVIVRDIAGTGAAIAGDSNMGPPSGDLLKIGSITTEQAAGSAQSQILVEFDKVEIAHITPNGGGNFLMLLCDMGDVDVTVFDERYTDNYYAIFIDHLVNKFRIKGKLTSNATGMTEYIRAQGASGRIKKLIIDDVDFSSNAAGGGTQGTARLYGGNSGGRIDDVQISNLRLDKVKGINNTPGNYPHNIQFSNILVEDGEQMFGDSGNSQQLVVVGAGLTVKALSFYVLMPTTAQGIRFVADAVKIPANKLLIEWGSGIAQINCPSAQLNFSGAGARLGALAGDMLFNTNAGYGAGAGMYGYTAAGAWSKIF